MLLAKDLFQFQILHDLMENEISSIWLRIGRKGNIGLIVGGVYREHSLLYQQLITNPTSSEFEQNKRWNKFISQWMAVSDRGQCVIISDTNLDTIKWMSPDQANMDMVEAVIDNIEGVTKFWSRQASSLIDQVWVVISTINTNRVALQHRLHW